MTNGQRIRIRLKAFDHRMPSNECEYAGRSSFRLLLIKDCAH